MLNFYTAQQSQQLDQAAVQNLNLPSFLLMKRAGLFAFNTLSLHYPNAKTLHCLCSIGHNAGDGLIVAQLATMAGWQVTVSILGEPAQLMGDTLQAYHEAIALGINVQCWSAEAMNSDHVKNDIATADIVVDALFGTGLNRAITGHLADFIEWLNVQKTPILALDSPSGLNPNTGQPLGVAIKAQRTCCFISRKIGLYTALGGEYAGKIHFSDLFVPPNTYTAINAIAHNHPLKYWLNTLPKKQPSRHKGVAGTALLVGGDRSMMGAIQLAGLSGLRLGAGLVKIISHAQHSLAITQAIPELMCYDTHQLHAQAQHAKVIAIGPGLGTQTWGQSLWQQTLAIDLPKVVDADALTLLSTTTATVSIHQNNWILTPHPGEAARLLGLTTAQVQADRIEAVKRIQQRYGGVVVLKGHGTLVYDGARLEICLAGNPGMAVGGMGDVLTGCIASLVAQGLDLFNAACLGVSLHAHAGDVLAQQQGQTGLLPSELPAIMRQLLHYAQPS
jgi:NAD(P)H-hydrate epimerase